MDLYISYVLFVLGIVMIVKGSDWFVDSAVWGAKIFKIPEIVIGATIVSVCTTLPETIVAITATFRDEANMIVGNSLGSIGANTGLILAIMFVFSKEDAKMTKAYRVNGLFLMAVLLLAWSIGFMTGKISRLSGLFLFVLLLFFLYKNFAEIRKKEFATGDTQPKEQRVKFSPREAVKYLILFALGLWLVVWGASLVVDKGILIADSLGIPTIVIAIVFTSFGTSLPELVTAITSVRKGAVQLGMGNIIGANVLNLLQVIGFSALIAPIDLQGDKSILLFQFPALLVICGVAVFFNPKGNKRKQKFLGISLFVLYLIFLIVNIFREATPFIGKFIF